MESARSGTNGGAAFVTPRMRRIAMLVVVAVLAAGCASSSKGAGPATSSTVAPTTNGSTSTSMPTTLPLFVTRIEIRPSVVGGSEVTATLVVRNESGKAVDLLSTNGNVRCTPKWTIALGNAHIPADVSFAKECGSKPLVVRPGENRFQVKVLARYSSCDSPGKPACVGIQRRPPPLPPGRYDAVLVGGLPRLPKPVPVPVQVT